MTLPSKTSAPEPRSIACFAGRTSPPKAWFLAPATVIAQQINDPWSRKADDHGPTDDVSGMLRDPTMHYIRTGAAGEKDLIR